MDDLIAEARLSIQQRWAHPGSDMRAPLGVVRLGDWASERLEDLLDVAERLRVSGEANRLRLRAIRRIHRMTPVAGSDPVHLTCSACMSAWPCETYRAITTIPRVTVERDEF